MSEAGGQLLPQKFSALHDVLIIQGSGHLLIFTYVGEGRPGVKYFSHSYRNCSDRRPKEVRPEPGGLDRCSEATWAVLAEIRNAPR